MIKRKIITFCFRFILIFTVSFFADNILISPQECLAQTPTKSIGIKGKIGGKYSFTMNLRQYSDNSISGSYFYGDGKNGSLEIVGTRTPNGTIYLYEYNDKGEQTGFWEIIIKKQKGRYQMSGYMINYKGTKYPLTGYQM